MCFAQNYAVGECPNLSEIRLALVRTRGINGLVGCFRQVLRKD
jgi:hypothetical protein